MYIVSFILNYMEIIHFRSVSQRQCVIGRSKPLLQMYLYLNPHAYKTSVACKGVVFWGERGLTFYFLRKPGLWTQRLGKEANVTKGWASPPTIRSARIESPRWRSKTRTAILTSNRLPSPPRRAPLPSPPPNQVKCCFNDFTCQSYSFKDLLSAYHFKLALHSSSYHVGEVHWSHYTDSLITSLPYRWQHPADTKLKVAHFVKQSPSSSATKQRWLLYLPKNWLQCLGCP